MCAELFEFLGAEAIRQEIEARNGIFRVVVEAKSGEYLPGDDLLFLIVAGDFP